MANTATNVTVGKPAVTGGIYRAPLGTTLPTDATTALDADFESLGYIAEGGVTKSTDMTSTTYRAWGGDPVLSFTDEKTDTFAFGLIEVLNKITYEITHGAANVTGTMSAGLTVRGNSSELDENVYVIELALRGGAKKRIVLPDAKVTEIGDVVYQDSEAVVYPVTLTALAGSDGDTYKEYVKAAS